MKLLKRWVNFNAELRLSHFEYFVMKFKISYAVEALRFYKECRTLKDVEREIKHNIDMNNSFKVYGVMILDEEMFKRKYPYIQMCMRSDFELFVFNADTNCISTYRLRENKYKKIFAHAQKRLHPILLRYGL